MVTTFVQKYVSSKIKVKQQRRTSKSIWHRGWVEADKAFSGRVCGCSKLCVLRDLFSMIAFISFTSASNFSTLRRRAVISPRVDGSFSLSDSIEYFDRFNTNKYVRKITNVITSDSWKAFRHCWNIEIIKGTYRPSSLVFNIWMHAGIVYFGDRHIVLAGWERSRCHVSFTDAKGGWVLSLLWNDLCRALSFREVSVVLNVILWRKVPISSPLPEPQRCMDILQLTIHI